jgi:hypothetical protein
VSTSQFSIDVIVEGMDDAGVEQLLSADFRSFASYCLGAHFGEAQIVPGEELQVVVSPGKERQSTLPDVKCLETFLAEVKDSRGAPIGACEFRRIVFLDVIQGLATRMAREYRTNVEAAPTSSEERSATRFTYCLHYHPGGTPPLPRLKVPPVRRESIDLLIARSTRIPLLSGDTASLEAGHVTFMAQDVFSALTDLAARGESLSLEEGCFLDGEVLYDPDRRRFARVITECLPAIHAERGESSLRINGDCWAHYNRTRSGGAILMGEGHSHPRNLTKESALASSVFMSTNDRSIHRNFFWQFYQCTVIVSNSAEGKLELGIWGHKNGFIAPESEAYILSR